MEPLISPWVIYWIDRLDAIKFFLGFWMFALGSLAFGFFLYSNDSCYPKYKIYSKICAAICIIFMIFMVFIPDKSTIYKMLIVQQVTPHNIEMTGKTLEKGFEIISDKVIKFMGTGKDVSTCRKGERER